jgi:glycosyltransferase involved in cell wall biosynthesis
VFGDVRAGGVAVSVIVSVYRNAATVESLQEQLSDVLGAHGLEFETVFVDDACPEGSGRLLRELAARDGRVRVVSHARNRGHCRAVMTGLAVASGQWVVVMDADLQDPPEAIPALLATGCQGFAAVFAGLRGQYEPHGRLLTSRIFKRLLSRLCGVPPDAGSFVAISRPVVRRILTMACGRSSVVALVGMAGLPVTSIPVDRRPRPHGRSAYSSWGRLRLGATTVFWILWWKMRSRRLWNVAPPGNGTR